MQARLLAALALAGAALLLPQESRAQRVADDPAQPRDPRTMQVCDAMAAEWRALLGGARAQHQSCLDANQRGKSCKASAVEGATCSCPACEALHVEMNSIPKRMNAAVSACREKVRAFEKEQKRREEEERKRKEDEERLKRELERKRKVEEADRLRAEAEVKREQERLDRIKERSEGVKDRDEDKDRREATRAAEEEHSRQQEAVRQEAVRQETARQEREEADRRRREEMDRDRSMLETAAQMTQIQEQLLARRKAEREAYVRQLEEQQNQRREAARQEQASSVAGIAEAFAGVKDALIGKPATPASDDLLGGFDIPTARPEMETINRLLNHGKREVPFAAIPFELIRSSVSETLAAPDRIFRAIGDMENSDPRMLDEVVNGFNHRVIGPRNFARILTEHWKTGVKQQAQAFTKARLAEPATREAQRRMGEAFRTRNPRALFEPRSTALPNVRVHGWWTEQGTGRMRTVTDDRGVPILIDASGKLFRFNPSRNTAGYTAAEVPGLIAQHGLRLARVGETEFRPNSIILSPIMPEEEAVVDVVKRLKQGWYYGELVGAALSPREDK